MSAPKFPSEPSQNSSWDCCFKGLFSRPSNSNSNKQTASVNKVAQKQLSANANELQQLKTPPIQTNITKLSEDDDQENLIEDKATQILNNKHSVELIIEKLNKNQSNGSIASSIGDLLKNLDVSDPKVQDQLIDLAISEAKKYPKGLPQHIKDFHIDPKKEKGQEALRVIATICARTGYPVSPYIENFSINVEMKGGKEALSNIAMLDSYGKPSIALFPYLKNYGINLNTKEGLDFLLEIVRHDVRNGHTVTSHLSDLKSYNFDQKVLVEIAKMEIKAKLINKDNIQHYGFDQQILAELAFHHISFLTFTSNKDLKNVLEMYQIDDKLINNGRMGRITSNLIARCLQKKDLEKKPKLLDNMLANIKEVFIDHLDKPETQEDLINIARFALESKAPRAYVDDVPFILRLPSLPRVPGIESRLYQLGLNFTSQKGKEALIGLASINPNVCLYLKEYNFDAESDEGQKAIIQLAYFHVREMRGPLPQSIMQALPIKEDVWIEIAKMAALHSPCNTVRYLNEYNIYWKSEKGRKAQKEILSLALEQSLQAGKVWESYKWGDDDFDHQTIEHLQNIIQYVKFRDSKIVRGDYQKSFPHFLFPRLLKAIDEKNVKKELSNILNEIESVAKDYPYLPIEILADKIKKNGELLAEDPSLLIRVGLTIPCFSSFAKEESKDIKKIFGDLVETQYLDFYGKYKFTSRLINIHSAEKLEYLIKTYNNIKGELPLSKKTSESLLALDLAIRITQGQRSEKMTVVYNNLRKLQSNKGNYILRNRDRSKTLFKALVALDTVAEQAALNFLLTTKEKEEFKERLIEKLTNDSADEVNKKCQMFALLAELDIWKAATELKQASDKDFDQKLSDAYYLVGTNSLPEETKKLLEKQEKKDQFTLLLDQLRDSNSFLSYFARLKNLNENEWKLMQKPIAHFFENILNEEFPKCRYNIKGSEHLEKVFSFDPSLKEKWTKKLDDVIAPDEQKQANELIVSDKKDKKPKDQFHVFNTDDLNDLLFCTTEVAGNCLSLNADLWSNKCLLSIIDDGKTRVIAIKKNEEKVIKAFAFIRILLTEEQKPVLLLDDFYPLSATPFMKKGIIEMAKRMANDLNLPLVTNNKFKYKVDTSDYHHSLHSLSGQQAPFEYVNSAEPNIIVLNGKFMLAPELLREIKVAPKNE